MAQCKRSSGIGVQTRSSANSSRRLRKRRLSLRYGEDDTPLEFVEKFTKTEVDADKLLLDGSPSKKLFHTKMNDSTPTKKPTVHRAPTPTVDEPHHSDRDSVLSCDSYDSGVGSRSDEDGVALPSTPDKQAAKPITIEVVSPASRGVIELIDNGTDGYIGYFKPSPSSSNTDTGCTNCTLMKRCRVTRSISTNVSEDSNDSAFQGFRSKSNRRRDTHDAIKSLSFIDNSRADKYSEKILKKTDATIDKQKTVRYRRRDKKTPVIKRGSVKPSHKVSLHRRVSPTDSKQLLKCSSAKRALLRIQHHNRSPERPSDPSTPSVSSRNCRTRSHAKSLLKGFVTTPTSADSKSSTARPKHSVRRHSYKAAYLGPNVERGRCASLSKSPCSPRYSPKTSGTETSGTDSGVASDDQQSVTSSACQWRFCKTVVSPADLSDHIERLHVASQRRNSRMYKCYWEGCKVYGQVAKSIIWLEGHVKKHLGARPYHCIFAECSARFPSHELLQKHVDTHIDDVQPAKSVRKVEPSVNRKNEKKKIKRMRGTEKCIPKRTDFFISNIIEAGRWEQKVLQENWSHLLSEDRSSLILHGQIVSMATEKGAERVQLHWFPEELHMADSWHDKNDQVTVTRTKEVKLSKIERHLLTDLLQSSSH